MTTVRKFATPVSCALLPVALSRGILRIGHSGTATDRSQPSAGGRCP